MTWVEYFWAGYGILIWVALIGGIYAVRRGWIDLDDPNTW